MQDNDQWWSIDQATWQWPFGKHLGKRLDETPASYLEWVCENFAKGPYRKACQREIARRDQKLAERLGIAVDEPGGVQGRYDCSSQFNPNAHWPEATTWDGVSAPWAA